MNSTSHLLLFFQAQKSTRNILENGKIEIFKLSFQEKEFILLKLLMARFQKTTRVAAILTASIIVIKWIYQKTLFGSQMKKTNLQQFTLVNFIKTPPPIILHLFSVVNFCKVVDKIQILLGRIYLLYFPHLNKCGKNR